MNRFLPVRLIAAMIVFAFYSHEDVCAQSSLPVVPATWPTRIQDSLKRIRDSVSKHLKEYDQRADAFNARCGGTIDPSNTSLISYCQAESDAIDARAVVLKTEKDQYVALYRDNEKLFSPNTDPNVVDARHARIPMKVDSALSKVFKDATPDVAERVRKGFQAVETKDWVLAKAWFEDALLRDPGNAAIKSFIAVCNSSEKIGVEAKGMNDDALPYNKLTTLEKNVLNTWIHNAREAARDGVYRDATGGLPASALDRVRKYVYGLSDEERENLFFPESFMVNLILFDMQK